MRALPWPTRRSAPNPRTRSRRNVPGTLQRCGAFLAVRPFAISQTSERRPRVANADSNLVRPSPLEVMPDERELMRLVDIHSDFSVRAQVYPPIQLELSADQSLASLQTQPAGEEGEERSA